MKNRLIVVGSLLVVVVVGIIIYAVYSGKLVSLPNNQINENEEIVLGEEDVKEEDVNVENDDSKLLVNGLDDELKILEQQNKARLSQGCFDGKDCIKSIDDPVFVSATQADADFLNDEDWVIGLDRNGISRAYPLKIMNWHEIVNDRVGDEYIAITFCPLCFTGTAFERVVDSEPAEFGVSGYLLNSNLVMYDRNTDSLWQQLTGEAITGPKIGSKLKKITVSTMLWEDWVNTHPDTEVLSTQTGFDRDYEFYPYGNYETSKDVYFALENSDNRLFEKELTYGIVVADKSKAYSIALLDEKFPDGAEFEDTVGGHSVKIVWKDKKFSAFNLESGDEIVAEVNFWFAWAAFYPETEIYAGE